MPLLPLRTSSALCVSALKFHSTRPSHFPSPDDHHRDSPTADQGLEDSSLYNADLAPVPAARRTWTLWNYAALWISMSACIPTYMLASSLIGGGMNWSQAVGTIFLGNLIVLAPMILNAHAGTQYGIPFPVYCRAAFGTVGANVPALLRALVACGWFGIQTWIGGNAIFKILGIFFPALAHAHVLPPSEFRCPNSDAFCSSGPSTSGSSFEASTPSVCCSPSRHRFSSSWGWVSSAGPTRQRAVSDPCLSQPSAFAAGQPKAGQFFKFFVPALTGMISFWATLSLNIPDFSRYARSQRDQVAGQALGLPATMAFYSFIGVAVTSATAIIYGKTLWDPVDVLTRFTNPVVLIVAMLALCVATLATNIAANVVGPPTILPNSPRATFPSAPAV